MPPTKSCQILLLPTSHRATIFVLAAGVEHWSYPCIDTLHVPSIRASPTGLLSTSHPSMDSTLIPPTCTTRKHTIRTSWRESVRYRFSNRYYETETKSLGLHHRVKHLRLFSVLGEDSTIPEQFWPKKYMKPRKRPTHMNFHTKYACVQLLEFELRISCLACTFITISPTLYLWWEEIYFSFEVTYRWASGTGW